MSLLQKLELFNPPVSLTKSARADGIIYSEGGILKYDNGGGPIIVAGAGGPNVNKLDDLSDAVTINVGSNNLLRLNGTNFTTALGVDAGNAITTGVSNILIGQGAGQVLTTGTTSVMIGKNSGNATLNSTNNVVIGHNACNLSTTFSNSVYVGYQSGHGVGGTVVNLNTYVGAESGFSGTTGSENTGIGASAGRLITTGNRNTLVGQSAGGEITTGTENICIGVNSGNAAGYATLSSQYIVANSSTVQLMRGDMVNQNLILGYSGIATADFKTATKSLMLIQGTAPNADADLGSLILYNEGGILKYRGQSGGAIVLNGLVPNLTDTIANTGLGNGTLDAITGGNNAAFGYQAMTNATNSNDNVAVGFTAMLGLSIGNRNVGVGSISGYGLTTGLDNTLLGYGTGRVIAAGSNNTFVGASAGYSAISGENTFIGFSAGRDNTTGSTNTFIGKSAGFFNTTASGNTAVGHHALRTGTSATGNVAVGLRAGEINQGNNNSFVGSLAGTLNNAGANNTCFGYLTGSTNVSGNKNVYIGSSCGQVATGSNNTLIGATVGTALTTGSGNVMVGENAGRFLTVQNSNVIIGKDALSNANCISADSVVVGNNSGVDITTGTANLLVGNNAGSKLTTGTGNIILGNNAATDPGFTSTSNQLIIANNASNQAIRSDLSLLNTAFGWVGFTAPNYYAASSSVMLVNGTLPSGNADSGQLILTHNTGKLYLRAQNGNEEVATNIKSTTTITAVGTYNIATLTTRTTKRSLFGRFSIKNTFITADVQSGMHCISWNNTGASTTATITAFGLAPASPLANISFVVTNDGVSNITLDIVAAAGNFVVDYAIIDSL
jgi:hypothetical protein